jgi:cell wall-associated NlpC family hydrolase
MSAASGVARRLLPGGVLALLAACAPFPEAPPQGGVDGGWASWGSEAPQAAAQRIVDSARRMLGAPYRWGGSSPQGFDCSGLVWFAYREAGLSVPRTSEDQYRAARPVGIAAARPGDLVFFGEGSRVDHVGIYLGDRRFIHAPESGQVVKVSSIENGYYRARFAGAGSLL